MNISSSVKKILLKHIEQMEQHKEDFVKRPFQDFSRKSKLSFQNTIMSLISMERSSITSELQKYFDYSVDTPTSSAFIQQRDKLKPDAFQHLFHAFSKEFSSQQYNGFNVFAVDGSDIHIPTIPDDYDTNFSASADSNGYNLIHLNTLYDLMNRRYGND